MSSARTRSSTLTALSASPLRSQTDDLGLKLLAGGITGNSRRHERAWCPGANAKRSDLDGMASQRRYTLGCRKIIEVDRNFDHLGKPSVVGADGIGVPMILACPGKGDKAVRRIVCHGNGLDRLRNPAVRVAVQVRIDGTTPGLSEIVRARGIYSGV